MIAIVDYGLGNIRAFANIYKKLGIPHSIVTGRDELNGAKRIILPGVGAFDHAMERLNASGMRGPIEELVKEQRLPVLGICVGMQILANASEEGSKEGLGWIEGTVKKIRFSGSAPGILPHMGWNAVRPVTGNPLFVGLAPPAEFYFLHSYYFEPKDAATSIAETDYSGSFACAVNNRNIYGVQFHPEKSHHNGVRVLRNFAEI